MPLQILQNGNSKSLISKEQKKTDTIARVIQQIQINPKYNKKNCGNKFIKPVYLETTRGSRNKMKT